MSKRARLAYIGKQLASKKEMKENLQDRIKKELPIAYQIDALILLDQFEKIFEIKRYAEEEDGIKKYYYYTIGYTAALNGYVRDIRVNSTAGKYMFGDYAELGTLTATLWRIKSAIPDGKGNYVHEDYGVISAEKYDLAMEICAVLNNYDEGHC